jgi:hypothetical protein
LNQSKQQQTATTTSKPCLVLFSLCAPGFRLIYVFPPFSPNSLPAIFAIFIAAATNILPAIFSLFLPAPPRHFCLRHCRSRTQRFNDGDGASISISIPNNNQ